jgi:hypothetical protein
MCFRVNEKAYLAILFSRSFVLITAIDPSLLYKRQGKVVLRALVNSLRVVVPILEKKQSFQGFRIRSLKLSSQFLRMGGSVRGF